MGSLELVGFTENPELRAGPNVRDGAVRVDGTFFSEATVPGGMGHCIGCGAEIIEVVESDTDAKFSDANVWECPECGAVLGVSEYGV